ncbi:hypothetical protein ASF49_11840 [Methylobacterium sp. Leaf104]|uniref:hypothetical protein n=1 Tax=Methylobacterium TaxID=407 RepID=UPI0006F84D1B|nr:MULTISPECIES: hypothetical protein [Methylobacterium]KQP31249.1 hypothetical protein ASF49_11840 [Methylobacterium sp. Leaf104]MCI9881352.1 hypothetical protein [Methylobacterium goesingense]
MRAALDRLWITVKAILAIGLLAAGSLYSANIVDRKSQNTVESPPHEPALTGSIKPGPGR